ncbi:synaptic vesicle VAT-1 family membrane protein [Peredibacter starrii]|uniref:Medium chain dehydrogenase/reductase family protein n=1 Tax=Peredibacter starrii TaxID=28202 RepID=A0AAX4HV32_9BACT|nr:medium chain dehydrogenase/reductase family protein [Peredibacter starrii]WPU66841.1 medium chain dehydrogenase/reductase family protein [Peredibacter starrii]
MKKIVIHRAGDYSQLKFETHPDLIINADSILVEVRASGVNYADIAIRWGLYESAKKFVGWPITPGFEFAGIVKATGQNITKFKAGDKVFGVTLFNAYASEVLVPEHQLFHLPENMSFEEAAAIPAVFMTAYHALFQNVVIRPGMIALIHSAAGGVGSSLVQLCKIAGITSIGVVGSSHKVQTLKDLGCDHIIDKSSEDLWKKVEVYAPYGVDLAFDANGLETLQESYNHLAPCGKLFAYGAHTMLPKTGGKVNWPKLIVDYLRAPRFNPINMTSENKSILAFNLSFLFSRKDLFNEAFTDLMKWFAEGKLRVPKVTTYALEKVGDAHRDLESGKTVGKLILIP